MNGNTIKHTYHWIEKPGHLPPLISYNGHRNTPHWLETIVPERGGCFFSAGEIIIFQALKPYSTTWHSLFLNLAIGTSVFLFPPAPCPWGLSQTSICFWAQSLFVADRSNCSLEPVIVLGKENLLFCCNSIHSDYSEAMTEWLLLTICFVFILP